MTDATTSQNSLIRSFPAFGFPLYRRYWLASLASVSGTQMATLGYGWLVFEMTHSPLALGVVGTVSSVCYIIMAIFGGAIADRYDKRMILITTSCVAAALLALIGILDVLDQIEFWQILLICGLSASVGGVAWPTRHSYFPHLIKPAAMMSAVALNSMLWQITAMSIPALGGLVLAWYGTSAIFFLGACGSLTMAVVMLGINVRVEGDQETTVKGQIKEGFQFILSNRIVWMLILLSYMTMIFGAGYGQLFPAFIKLLGAEEIGFGMLLASAGSGAMIGGIIAGTMKPGRFYGIVLLTSATFFGVFALGFLGAVIIPSYLAAVVMVAIAGAFSSLSIVLVISALQIITPAHLLGRVMGIEGIAYSMMPIGGLIIGFGADRFGLLIAAAFTIGVFLLFVLVLVIAAGSIRRLNIEMLLQAKSQ